MSEGPQRVVIDVHIGPDEWRKSLQADALAGLQATPKTMPPTWFYDDRGSQLFDQITQLPEYYLTRAERAILEAHAGEIVALTQADTLIELGSGTSEKTELLLKSFESAQLLKRFVPFDVSEGFLREAATQIASRYPSIEVHAVVGDFNRHIDQIPAGGRRMVIFLGSTIGNLNKPQRAGLLGKLASTMMPGDFFLLGADLRKAPERLVAAYDDSQGISAAFNLNLLSVLNAALEADFDVDSFEHRARWNPEAGQMEMSLQARGAQKIRVKELELDVVFEDGEEIETEISTKFTPSQLEAELNEVGFSIDAAWQDPAGDFQLTLARR